MTPTPSRTRGLRILAGATLGIVFVTLACEAPRPVADGEHSAASITGPIFDESEVDQPPILLSHPPMQYPPLLRDAGVQGKVVLEFVIDTNGRVDTSSIVVVSSDQKAFERPAIDLVTGSRYRAGTNGGATVRVRVRQPVSFSIVGMEQAVTPSLAEQSGLQPVNAVAYPVTEQMTRTLERLDSTKAPGESLVVLYEMSGDTIRPLLGRLRPDSR